jgi:hypothetical protein
MLRKIYGPQRAGKRSWKKLHSDVLHSLYSSPNIVGVIKSRRMKKSELVARMEEGKYVYRVLLGRPERRPSRR